jgi:Dolichyl-phosphate-mannose-protein mannosyltransferase
VRSVLEPALLFLLALGLRLRFNNVQKYSKVDETTNLDAVNQMLRSVGTAWRAFPFMTQDFLEDRRYQPEPPPRLFWCWIQAWMLRPFGAKTTHRGLATLSTLFSAFSPPLAYLLATQYGLPALPAFFAGCLVLTSPIHLAMGRRVLHDAPMTSLALLAFYAAKTGNPLFMGLSFFFLILSKEAAVLLGPSLFYIYVTRTSLHFISVLPFFIASCLYAFLLFVGLRINLRELLNIIVIVQPHDDYSKHYERGSWHTYLVQSVLLSPLLCILAIRAWTWNPLSIALLLYTVLLSFGWKKNYRSFTIGDAVLRILAAGIFLRLSTTLSFALLGVCGWIDLSIFQKTFIKDRVYDPVFHSVAKSQGMVPP